MQVQEVAIEKVRPYHRNPRGHSDENVRKIADSIREFDFNQPIVVDKDFVVIAGHGRLLAARELKRKTVPIFVAKHLDASQVAAYRLADNRIGADSEWDEALLKIELQDLNARQYALGQTGFTKEEIDELLASVDDVPGGEGSGGAHEDDIPEAPAEAVTREGDLWTLGNHRLYCGDGTLPATLGLLTKGLKVKMVYTDPPYGVEIVQETGMTTSISDKMGPAFSKGGKVGGDKAFGKVGGIHRGMKARPIIAANTYAPIIGDATTDTAVKMFNLCATLTPRPVLIFWGGNYYADKLPPSSCWVVWDKNNGESFFADAELAWTNQPTAVRIFKHTWNGLVKESERGEKRVHPTQKPVALAEWCFEKYGKPGDVVLDLCGGSGSTLIAAEKSGRRALLCEWEAAYCDVIIRRWQTKTNKDAMLRGENLTWNEAKKMRRTKNGGGKKLQD